MSLIHYSAAPVTQVRSVQQWGKAYKPQGLWLSVEDDTAAEGWWSWCHQEGVWLDSLAYEHDVVLDPTANILRLTDADALDTFTQRYGSNSLPIAGDGHIDRIDWRAVAEQYQGIIIAPYVWSRRLTLYTFWYYGWDCASGCVWDADAVASVTLRKRP